MKKNLDKNFTRLVVITILILFLATSANSALIKVNNNSPPVVPLGQPYYEWRDDFEDEQKIDLTKSWGYVVDYDDGIVLMKNTYEVWDDTDWEKMKPVTVTNSGGALTNIAVNFIVEYDPDMQSDYDDIRFKHENNPAIFLDYWLEDYDSSEASVWVEVPNLKAGTNNMYLFYGNPTANSESDFGSVFTDWEEEWANDEQISYHANSEGAWDPDVACGNDKFLVAWEEGQAYWIPYSYGFKQEIRASMYSNDGGDPVVFDKRIYKDSYTYFRNEDPSIAYGGNGVYAVAWEHYQPKNAPPHNPAITTMDIYARTVERSGNDFTLGTLEKVCEASNCQADANVEFDSVNDQFMIVWEDARDGTSDYDIWARLYDTDLDPVGSEVRLNNDANAQCEPWAAYDPINEQYFIVWEDGVNPEDGPFRIMGGLFDEDLNEIDTFTVAEPSNYPNDDIDYNFPCVEFDEESERFLVTWNDCDISDGDWHGDIWGKIYDTSGDVVVSQFSIRNGNFVRTDIVPYLSEAFLVSFDNNQKVYGKLISAEGDAIGGDIQLSASPASDADWANLATDGSKVFVAWEDLRMTYPPPYDDWYPDAFGNLLNLNIPDGSDITINFGDEKEMILEAQVTSKKIDEEHLKNWHEFQVEFDNTITFDILDETATIKIIEGADNGEDLSWIDPEVYDVLRLQAHFTRDDPSYTPELDWWLVLYEGLDEEPPVTEFDYEDCVWGQNDWMISECATIWLKATDYPETTGSGVNKTYYTLNGGPTQIYNDESGIHICATAPDWYGYWVINIWSIDYAGNVENRTKPENTRPFKIDARPPEVWITTPTEEAEVQTPFWVKAEASDNACLESVSFDIEPFDQRLGLPWYDYTPPWEWLCDEEPLSRVLAAKQPYPAGVMVQIRATAHDCSGQYWRHQVFVQITNWNSRPRTIVIPNFKLISEKLKFGFAIDDKLDIEMSGVDTADTVEFVATKMFTREHTTILDNDFSDGISASFDIPTGFYKISAISYKEGEEIASDLLYRVFFINR